MQVNQERNRLSIVLGVATLLASLPVLLIADPKLTATEEQEGEGHALLQGTREHREAFSPNFGGFRAELSIRLDGKQHSGTLLFKSPRTIEVKLEDEEVQPSTEETLRSMIFHRMPPRRRDSSQPQKSLRLGEPDKHWLGRKVYLGDRFESSYRIRDNQILEINRQMGDTRLLITVIENQFTPKGRHLPRHFLVTLFDMKTGALKSASAYIDEYVEMDGNFLPKRRQITSTRNGRTQNLDILLEEIELLEELKLTSSTE